LLVEASVLCLCFDITSNTLAVGDAIGHVTLFNILDGTIIRTIRHAHAKSILCISLDSGRVLTGGVDSLARVFGLVSGAAVCELRGHSGYINACAFVEDHKCVTASQDRTVRGWHTGTGECVFAVNVGSSILRMARVRSSPVKSGVATSLRTDESDRVILCTARSLVTVNVETAKVVGEIKADDSSDFVDFCVSRSGGELVSVNRQGVLTCWDQGKLLRKVPNLVIINDKEQSAVQCLYHPSENVLAVLTTGGLQTFE